MIRRIATTTGTVFLLFVLSLIVIRQANADHKADVLIDKPPTQVQYTTFWVAAGKQIAIRDAQAGKSCWKAQGDNALQRMEDCESEHNLPIDPQYRFIFEDAYLTMFRKIWDRYNEGVGPDASLNKFYIRRRTL